jgi:hypothetical protein
MLLPRLLRLALAASVAMLTASDWLQLVNEWSRG